MITDLVICMVAIKIQVMKMLYTEFLPSSNIISKFDYMFLGLKDYSARIMRQKERFIHITHFCFRDVRIPIHKATAVGFTTLSFRLEI